MRTAVIRPTPACQRHAERCVCNRQRASLISERIVVLLRAVLGRHARDRVRHAARVRDCARRGECCTRKPFASGERTVRDRIGRLGVLARVVRPAPAVRRQLDRLLGDRQRRARRRVVIVRTRDLDLNLHRTVADVRYARFCRTPRAPCRSAVRRGAVFDRVAALCPGQRRAVRTAVIRPTPACQRD